MCAKCADEEGFGGDDMAHCLKYLIATSSPLVAQRKPGGLRLLSLQYGNREEFPLPHLLLLDLKMPKMGGLEVKPDKSLGLYKSFCVPNASRFCFPKRVVRSCEMKAKNFTLLLIDDDNDDRFFIERAFQKLGALYRIHGLANGSEAIAYIKGEGKYADRRKFQFPSYVITDLKMGQGDGFLVLDFIKKNPALSIIPVVMLSASTDPDDIRHSYLLGASSYFSKPQSPEDLDALIKAIHEYWAQCHVPEVDEDGFAIMTDSEGKAGARYQKPRRENKT